LRWIRKVDSETLEFWRENGDNWAGGNPLDRAPKLGPWESVVWDAYNWLLLYADGGGGFSPDSLDIYFSKNHPGNCLEDTAQDLIRVLMPDVISEDRKIERKRHKAAMAAVK